MWAAGWGGGVLRVGGAEKIRRRTVELRTGPCVAMATRPSRAAVQPRPLMPEPHRSYRASPLPRLVAHLTLIVHPAGLAACRMGRVFVGTAAYFRTKARASLATLKGTVPGKEAEGRKALESMRVFLSKWSITLIRKKPI